MPVVLLRARPKKATTNPLALVSRHAKTTHALDDHELSICVKMANCPLAFAMLTAPPQEQVWRRFFFFVFFFWLPSSRQTECSNRFFAQIFGAQIFAPILRPFLRRFLVRPFLCPFCADFWCADFCAHFCADFPQIFLRRFGA